MEKYDEEIFEAVADIVASALEENEVDINAEGGKKVAEFFLASAALELRASAVIEFLRIIGSSGGSGDDVLSFKTDNFNLQHLCILLLSPVICDGKNGSSNRLKLPQPQIPMIGNGPAI